jgi:hypothetical protein
MYVVAHQLEGDDLHAWTVVGAHSDQCHSKLVIFIFLKDFRLFFTRRTQVPDTFVLSKRHLEDPFAAVFLFKESVFVGSHIRSSL